MRQKGDMKRVHSKDLKILGVTVKVQPPRQSGALYLCTSYVRNSIKIPTLHAINKLM